MKIDFENYPIAHPTAQNQIFSRAVDDDGAVIFNYIPCEGDVADLVSGEFEYSVRITKANDPDFKGDIINVICNYFETDLERHVDEIQKYHGVNVDFTRLQIAYVTQEKLL